MTELVIAVIFKSIIAFLVPLLAVPPLIWAERRILGRIQSRVGPNRVGPFGLFQTLADAVKLLGKEDMIPAGADRALFILAPFLLLVPSFMAWSVVPIGTELHIFGRVIGLYPTDLNVGVLYIVALTSVAVYGIVMAGWASNSKYALLGSLRSSAQMISYEIMLGLALVGVVVLAGSLSLPEIVRQQQVPYAIPLFIGAFVFVCAALAETNRAPFDLPEAETELVSGYHVEYSGARFMFFFLAEYANMVLVSFLVSAVFLGGGWPAQLLEPYIGHLFTTLLAVGIMMSKVLLFLFFYFWIRATLPRFRYDQMMNFCWKVLLPLGLVNLAVATVLKLTIYA
ncbi:MAG: NADH-quinone oxidoreductase subunit NuoH [Chloroflexi bacterium]|nr:NADH-quinone oxidoreductase subunit NuoH [Chloroflexota bacterium]